MTASPNGKCFCGCGSAIGPGAFFKTGHDKKAEGDMNALHHDDSVVKRMADLGYPGTISGEAARRICCDAKISRIITDGPSEILDLGRFTRTVTPAQRRALNVRDKTCVFPGCRVPHDRCDAHHLIFWLFGGRSDLDNYGLLCPAHHRYVHEGGWTLIRNRDGTWNAYPP